MSRILKSCLAICLLALPATDSMAWRVRFDNGKNCPDLNRKISWHDYISNKIEPTGHSVGNPFGVEFRWAKSIGDRESIGNLRTNVCYTGVYVSKTAKSWPKLGYSTYKVSRNSAGKPNSKYRHGLSGDPLKYEINIDGVELLYTDSGFVLDRKGRRVGVLTCYGSDECERF